MVLKSIKSERRRLADEVYDQLLGAILNQEIGADDRLVQEKLATELQISRTPIREALLRLEQEGVLATSPRGGFTLYRMSEGEVKEFYQARAAVEGQAARILASVNNPRNNAILRRTIEAEESGAGATARDYFEANRKIHRKFLELVGNRYLLEMFDSVWNRAVSFQLFAAIERVDLAKSLGDHTSLVDAIETGDRGHALEVFTAHIQQGFDLQMEALGA